MGTGDSSGNTQTVCIRDLVSHSYRVIGTFETCPNKSGDPLGLISRLVSRYFYWLHENEKSARKSFQSMGHKESC
jgi:hypothetical protein